MLSGNKSEWSMCDRNFCNKIVLGKLVKDLMFDRGGPYCKNCTKKNKEVKCRGDVCQESWCGKSFTK